MFPDHGRIVVPVLKVVDGLARRSREGERGRIFIDLHFVRDVEGVVRNLLLSLQHSNYHRLDDVERWLRMVMRLLSLHVD